MLDRRAIVEEIIQAHVNLLSYARNGAIVQLSPIVGDKIQLRGDVKFWDELRGSYRSAEIYTAYGRNAADGYTGLWFTFVGRGQCQKMEFRPEYDEFQVHESLLGHARAWLESEAESGSLDEGRWKYDRA